MMKILMLGLVAIFVGGCAMAGSSVRLSDRELKSLAESGVKSFWQVEREQSGEGEFVFVYEAPQSISPNYCATHVLGFEVEGGDAASELVHRQEEWQLAFKPCSRAGLDDFRPVAGAVSKQQVAEAAKLLSNSIPAFGGSPRNVRFQAKDLELVFRTISPKNTVSIAFAQSGSASVSFMAIPLSPELLGVRITPNPSAITDVFVYRQSGPYPTSD